MDNDKEVTKQRDQMDIGTWFSLSYANYLVLPRTLLQSMPEWWQEEFVEKLQELGRAFEHLEHASYDVRCLKRPTEMILPRVPCEECNGTGGKDADNDGVEEGKCPYCEDGMIDDPEGHRYETPEEVGFRDDPIPHYDRGRTTLEPKPFR